MITIQDIAKKAGVPVKTASRAIAGLTQGKRRDAKERAERVLKVAKELGYQPSNIAQALRNGKTRTIGMVVGGLSNKYFGCLIETFLDEFDKYDYRLLLEVTKWNEAKEYECLKDLLRHRVDGIIYLCDLPVKMAQEHRMILDNGFPLMTIAANEHGFGMVRNDYTPAINSAVEFLHDRKNHDIGFVLPYGRRVESIEKEKVFTAICSKLGINGLIYRLGLDDRIDAVMDKQHSAWLIDGPNTLDRIINRFADEVPEYKPDVIGFYDDFDWERRNTSICGAIIRQTGKIIERVVREVIARIENSNIANEMDCKFTAKFAATQDFKHLKFRITPSSYHV